MSVEIKASPKDPFSQDVPPKGTDRFTITVANDLPGTYDWFIFDVSIEIFYNEGKSVTSRDLVFISPSEAEMVAMNENGDRGLQAFRRNYATAQDIKKSGGQLSEAVKRWIGDKDEQIPKALKLVMDSTNPIEGRIAAVESLGSLGRLAKDIAGQLKSLDPHNNNLASELKIALAKIESADSKPIDISFYREDGLEGCEPSPATALRVTKEEALAENQSLDEFYNSSINSPTQSSPSAPAPPHHPAKHSGGKPR
jgi:hypothetical protein